MEFFKSFHLYLEDPTTGRIKIKYVCRKCGVEMEQPKNFSMPCSKGGVPELWKTEFCCEKCKLK